MQPLPTYRGGDIPGGVGSSIYGPPTPQGNDGSALVRNALLNVLTLGEHQNPGSVAAYGSGLLHSFDPRTRAGAIDLASILVPGAAKGRPTAEQRAFLDAVSRSSYQIGPRAMPPQYDPMNPSVAALMEHLGKPNSLRMFGSPNSQALNPLAMMILNAGRGRGILSSGRNRLGLDPDASPFSGRYRGPLKPQRDARMDYFLGTRLGDVARHQAKITQLVNMNAIQRRN